MSEMKARNLVGMQVIAKGGRNVGSITDVMVDTGKWRVDALSVRLTRDALAELDLRKPIWGSQIVQIPVKEISGASDNMVLKHKLEDVKFVGGEREESAEANEESDACEEADEKKMAKACGQAHQSDPTVLP